MHFLKRQYWHLFLWAFVISQPPSATHVYTRLFCTVLLKKPLHLRIHNFTRCFTRFRWETSRIIVIRGSKRRFTRCSKNISAKYRILDTRIASSLPSKRSWGRITILLRTFFSLPTRESTRQSLSLEGERERVVSRYEKLPIKDS